jgi:peptide/nickel transport system substrate-binding protein
MQYRSLLTRIARYLSVLVCFSLFLAGCELEGGVPRPSDATPTPSLLQTSATVVPASVPSADTWGIGLLDEPRSLYPYPENAGAQRVAAPLTELLFPSPILSLNYGYTTTGVLERIPSLQNGDAELGQAQVYLDPTGLITTTQTEVVTQVEQLTVTFRWNRKLSWSDGKPVTADDSIFAYELAKQSPPGDDARDRLERIASYEKVDDYTTRAILRPDIIEPTFFLNFWTPLPRHLLQGVAPDEVYRSDFAYAPVGYGPYAIHQRVQGEIRMVRNQHYFGTQPAAEQLVISFADGIDSLRAAFLNGNLDAATTDRVPAEQFKPLDADAASGAIHVTYLPNPVWAHLDFNLDVPTLQDIRVRRAIAHAANRKAMVDTLFNGHGPVLESWVLPGQIESAPLDQLTRYAYDPDLARKLLDEAGYTVHDSGVRASPEGVTLTFQLLTVENKASPVLQEAARMFKQDMQAIGIEVELSVLPADQLFAGDGPLFQRQFDMALFAWIASSDPGGLPLWSCNAVPSEQNNWSGDNFAGWCFRDANRAIRQAVTALDPEERKQAYLVQQQKWTQEVPSLPLFQRLSLALTAPSLKGPQPDPLAPITWNIASWRRTK